MALPGYIAAMGKKPAALIFLEWTLALAVVALGVHISWGGKTKWIIIGNAVHFLPLVGLLLPWHKLRAGLLWFGVFLLLQGGYTLATAQTQLYKTLPPLMKDSFEVSGDILRGIDGLQTVTTDAMGFRVTRPVDYAADSTMRIFAIGASTTEQIYLDDRKTWTHLLQEKLGDEAEVINTGVSGLRAEHHLATLNAILPLRPDIVLVLAGVNDWNRHIREHFGSRHYQENKFRHSLAVATIRDGIAGIKSRLKRPDKKPAGANEDAAQTARSESGDFYHDKMGALDRREARKIWQPAEVDPRYASTMAEIARTCAAAKIICVFLTQPHGYAAAGDAAYRAHFWMTPPGEKYTLDAASLAHIASLYNDWLKTFACQTGMYFYDLAAGVPPGFASFYDDVHFNEGGAATVADLLAGALAAPEKLKAPAPCG